MSSYLLTLLRIFIPLFIIRPPTTHILLLWCFCHLLRFQWDRRILSHSIHFTKCALHCVNQLSCTQSQNQEIFMSACRTKAKGFFAQNNQHQNKSQFSRTNWRKYWPANTRTNIFAYSIDSVLRVTSYFFLRALMLWQHNIERNI
jgi:hypothetical protein